MSRSLGSRGRPAWAVPVVPLLLVCLAGPAAGGQEEKEKSFTVAKSLSPAGTFAARAGEGEPWRVIGEGEDLRSGELLVGLPGASLRGVNGAVRLIFRSDFEGRSPVPAMETAVRLHPPEGRDLDLTLDRGRVELVNARKEGPARVRLRFEDQQWDLTLAGPGARAAVEMAGRLPPGSRFRPRAKEDPEPTVYLVVLAVKGEAVVDTAAHRFHLHAPPGPALLYWDSVSDRYVPPVRLAELPDWAEPDKDLGPEAKKSQAVAAEFRELIVEKGIPEAIAEFYRSPDPVRQRIALIAMGATDDLRQLGEALSAAKNPVVWDFGIQVVRNWLGRAPGQARKLYRLLTEKGKLTPNQASTVLGLLQNLSERELASPLTYELLIEYLRGDVPAVRNLAAWHLYRLVPGAREKIPFKPNGTPEEFEAAYRAWKEFLPSGKVPADVVPETDAIPPPKK